MKIFQFLYVLGIICLLLGCGGGTSGTDSGGVQPRLTSIQGTIKNSAQQPVQGAVVTVLENGAQAISDSEGSFAIATELAERQLALAVATESVNQEINLGNIPAEDSEISLALTLEPTTIEVVSFSITPLTQPVEGSDPEEAPITTPTPDISPDPITRSLFEGYILLGTTPVANFDVTILSTEYSDSTDANGYFRIFTPAFGGSVALLIQGSNFAQIVQLPPIPPRAVRVSVTLALVNRNLSVPKNDSDIAEIPRSTELVIQTFSISNR